MRQRLHSAIISNRCMEGRLPLTLISLDNGAHCDHVSLQGEGIQNIWRKPTSPWLPQSQTNKWPELGESRERIAPLAGRWWHNPQFSHRTPGEIHSNGGWASVVCAVRPGRELSYEMKSGTWESLATIHRVSWSPTISVSQLHMSHCLLLTNFYINCHLIEADNLQLYLAWEKL